MNIRSEHGFTLIEALVALALGAVVMTAVLTMVKLGSATAARLAKAADTDEAVARMGDLLAGDAAHALAIAVTPDGLVFSGDAQSVRFAMLPRPRPDSVDPDPVIVAYHVMGGTYARISRSETALGQTEGKVMPVWDVAQPVALRYLDERGKWQSRWSDTEVFPRALGFVVGSDKSARPVIAGAFLPLVSPECVAAGAEDCPAGIGGVP